MEAEGQQLGERPNVMNNRRIKKKRSPEEGSTGYWWKPASASRKLWPCAEIVMHGDSLFSDQPD